MYLSISSFHPFAYLYNALNDNMLIHMYIDACTCTFPTMFRIDLMFCFCELMLCSEKADSDFEIHSTKTQISGSFKELSFSLFTFILLQIELCPFFNLWISCPARLLSARALWLALYATVEYLLRKPHISRQRATTPTVLTSFYKSGH